MLGNLAPRLAIPAVHKEGLNCQNLSPKSMRWLDYCRRIPSRLGLSVMCCFAACSRQIHIAPPARESASKLEEVSVKNVIHNRAAQYGLTLGYDAEKRRYASIVVWHQQQGEEAPDTARAAVLFLRDFGWFLGAQPAGPPPDMEDESDKKAAQDGIALFIERKDFVGMDSFFSFSRLKQMRTEEGSLASTSLQLDQEISLIVGSERVAFSSSDKVRKWTMSPGAADLIVEQFKTGGGRIVDEVSATRKKGPRAGLVDKAWLIAVPVENPPKTFDGQNGKLNLE